MHVTAIPGGGVLGQAWRDVKSVYYANTPVWRWLKSGTLVFFGFFCWTAAALLLSYRPDWSFLTYVMAYGFALIVWGPVTHFGIVPAVIRLRRRADGGASRWLSRHASKLNLTVFFGVVIILGTVAPGFMLLDFSGALAPGSNSPDATATIDCVVEAEYVECSIENVQGADHIVILTGDRELERIDDPPYTARIPIDELAEAARSKEFVVELRDSEGQTLRRYVRTV